MAKKSDKKTRDWTMNSSGNIYCYPDKRSKCFVPKLSEVRELAPFHDAELARATIQINEIIERVAQSNSDSQKQLSLLAVGNGLLMAWTHCGGIGSKSDPDSMAQALGLKTWVTTPNCE